MTFLKTKPKKTLAYMWVLTDKFYKSSPNSKYRLNFLSAPFAIYSHVSAALHGCQRPKMWRLFLRAMLPVPPPHRSLLLVEDLWAVQCLLHGLTEFRSVICSKAALSHNIVSFHIWKTNIWANVRLPCVPILVGISHVTCSYSNSKHTSMQSIFKKTKQKSFNNMWPN